MDMEMFAKLEAIFRFLDEQLKEVLGGLTYTEYLILKALVQSDVSLTPTLLARAANKVPTSFTPILDNLEKKKYIKRFANKIDRRSVNIRLVSRLKTTQLIAELEPRVDAVLNKYLTVEERALISLLHTRMYPVE